VLVIIDCLTVEVRVEERIIVFNSRQFAFDINGSHVGPAYDRKGLIYSCSILSFDLMGMGLERFKIRYSIPRTAVAFLIVDFICAENVRFRCRVVKVI